MIKRLFKNELTLREQERINTVIMYLGVATIAVLFILAVIEFDTIMSI